MIITAIALYKDLFQGKAGLVNDGVSCFMILLRCKIGRDGQELVLWKRVRALYPALNIIGQEQHKIGVLSLIACLIWDWSVGNGKWKFSGKLGVSS